MFIESEMKILGKICEGIAWWCITTVGWVSHFISLVREGAPYSLNLSAMSVNGATLNTYMLTNHYRQEMTEMALFTVFLHCFSMFSSNDRFLRREESFVMIFPNGRWTSRKTTSLLTSRLCWYCLSAGNLTRKSSKICQSTIRLLTHHQGNREDRDNSWCMQVSIHGDAFSRSNTWLRRETFIFIIREGRGDTQTRISSHLNS